MTKPSVVHVGNYGEYPGGMAQVVNGYLDWGFKRVQVSAILSTRGRGDAISPFRAMAAIMRIALARLRKRQIVVVHLSERGSFLREGAVLLTASALGHATIAHLHGAHFEDFARSHPSLVASVLRRADKVAALTERSEQTVRWLIGSDAAVVRVPNAVDLGPVIEAPRMQRTVVFAGEVSNRKGADVLAEAWGKAMMLKPDWTLLVLGPHTDETEPLRGLHNVTLRGAVNHSEVVAALAEAPAAVLPSRDEALPMSLLEAMSQSCAVIATDVGQVADICSKENGWLVKPGDAVGLAEAFSELSSCEPSAVLAKGMRSRQTVQERYATSVCMEKIEDLWVSSFNARRSSSIR